MSDVQPDGKLLLYLFIYLFFFRILFPFPAFSLLYSVRFGRQISLTISGLIHVFIKLLAVDVQNYFLINSE